MTGFAANLIYELTDTYFIGKLGSVSSLAAIVLSLPFLTFLVLIGNLLGKGAKAYFSRSLNQLNRQEIFTKLFLCTLLFGIFVSVLSHSFLDPIVQGLGVAYGTEDYLCTKACIRIFSLGSPLFILNNMLAQFIGGDETSKLSLTGTLLSVGINIILDPILIHTLHLGDEGAALATVAANGFLTLYYLAYAVRNHLLVFKFQNTDGQKKALSGILKAGCASVVPDLFFLVDSLVLNHCMMTYGNYLVAGFGIAQKLIQFGELITLGFCTGILPMIKEAYQSRNWKEIARTLKTAVRDLLVSYLLLAVIVWTFKENIFLAFTSEQAVIKSTVFMFFIQFSAALLSAGSNLIGVIFQAAGRKGYMILLTLIRNMLLLPVTIGMNTGLHLQGVMFSGLVTESLVFLLSLQFLDECIQKEIYLQKLVQFFKSGKAGYMHRSAQPGHTCASLPFLFHHTFPKIHRSGRRMFAFGGSFELFRRYAFYRARLSARTALT